MQLVYSLFITRYTQCAQTMPRAEYCYGELRTHTPMPKRLTSFFLVLLMKAQALSDLSKTHVVKTYSQPRVVLTLYNTMSAYHVRSLVKQPCARRGELRTHTCMRRRE